MRASSNAVPEDILSLIFHFRASVFVVLRTSAWRECINSLSRVLRSQALSRLQTIPHHRNLESATMDARIREGTPPRDGSRPHVPRAESRPSAYCASPHIPRLYVRALLRRHPYRLPVSCTSLAHRLCTLHPYSTQPPDLSIGFIGSVKGLAASMNIKMPTLEHLELENDMCLLEDKLQIFETWEAPALSRLVVAHGFQFQFPNIKYISVLDIPLSLRMTDFRAHPILLPEMLNLVNLGIVLDNHQRYQPTFSNSRCSSVGILIFINAASPITEPIKPI